MGIPTTMKSNLRDTSANPIPSGLRSDAPSRIESRSIFAAVLDNVGPSELVELAAKGDLDEFLRAYGETLFLLVRIRSVETELLAGLNVTALREDASVPVEPIAKTAEPTSDEFEATITGVRSRPLETEMRLIQLLGQERHCAVPLRKRITAEALNPTRVSVGRAPNKDIVLRHESVSKFHAWFELDESGAFYVTDAGSKNATWLNGKPIVTDAKSVQAGDSLRFGRVDTIVSSPRAIWRVLATAAKRSR
jgi:hypothetical protein